MIHCAITDMQTIDQMLQKQGRILKSVQSLDAILSGTLFVHVSGSGSIKLCTACHVITLRDLSPCNERERERGLNFNLKLL